MGEADLTGAHGAPTAEKPRRRHAVVRIPVGPYPGEQRIDRFPDYRMDPQCLLLLFRIERRQDARHALGKHRLPRSRRPYHEHPELPDRSDGDTALGGLLPHHVSKIQLRKALHLDGICRKVIHRSLDTERKTGKIGQAMMLYTCDGNMLTPGRTDEHKMLIASKQLIGNLAGHGTDLAVERELANKQAVVQPIQGNLPRRLV